MISPQLQPTASSSSSRSGVNEIPARRNVVSLKRSSLTRFASTEQAQSHSPPSSPDEFATATNCSSDRILARGILRQTAHDLRRFGDAHTQRQRHLYNDAYTWLMADDFAWPCSFLNVCATLGLQPEQTRAGLLKAATEPWYAHLLTVTRNTANSLVSNL